MNLCLNAFVIQFPDDLLDTCLVTASRALLLPFAHRGHCKDEDSYKECSSHVELSIRLTTIRRKIASPISAFSCGSRQRQARTSPLFEIARVVVSLDHAASFIVNANHGLMWAAEMLCLRSALTKPFGASCRR